MSIIIVECVLEYIMYSITI